MTGRNMDWPQKMGGTVWVLARGVEQTGLADDPNPLRWTSRYGSVVTTAFDVGAADGVNEKGLGAHLLWLTETGYGPRDERRPALGVFLWAQYFLDQFATVAECVAELEKGTFQVRPQSLSLNGADTAATVHLALEDAGGDSAIVEIIDGTPVVHHDPSYTVMTNSPPFDQQTEHLKQYEGFGGRLPLPGSARGS